MNNKRIYQNSPKDDTINNCSGLVSDGAYLAACKSTQLHFSYQKMIPMGSDLARDHLLVAYRQREAIACRRYAPPNQTVIYSKIPGIKSQRDHRLIAKMAKYWFACRRYATQIGQLFFYLFSGMRIVRSRFIGKPYKYLVVLIILFFTFFRETKAQKVSELPIIQSKITIDGKSNDWPNTLLQIPKSNYQYFAGIQEQRLLIGITFDDPILREQILMSGFTLWINEKGKKKEVLGIRYPLGLPEDQIPTDPGLLRDSRQQLADDPQTLINSFQHLELINFYGEGETTWGESMNPEGIQANVDMEDNGKLVYEISLPLDIIFKDPEKLKSPKAKGFVLGFISGNLERPAIRGDMSVGINGGSLSNPSRPEGTWERNMQKLLEEYREFTISREAWTQKYSLPRE